MSRHLYLAVVTTCALLSAMEAFAITPLVGGDPEDGWELDPQKVVHTINYFSNTAPPTLQGVTFVNPNPNILGATINGGGFAGFTAGTDFPGTDSADDLALEAKVLRC